MEELTQPDHEILDALIERYSDVIGIMPDDMFTSHHFILELARNNQGLYIKALNRYADSKSPFGTLHSLLAQALHEFGEKVEMIAKEVPSEDIFRRRRSCSLWRKKESVSLETD